MSPTTPPLIFLHTRCHNCWPRAAHVQMAIFDVAVIAAVVVVLCISNFAQLPAKSSIIISRVDIHIASELRKRIC